MAVLVTKWFGVFLIEGGRVVREQRFPASPRAIADRLLAIRRGEILEEERLLASGGVEVLEARLRSLGSVSAKSPFFDIEVAEPEARLLHDAALLVGRHESRLASGERDRFVAQSVRAMDELTKTVNTLVERLREWYGLHFPEALAQLPEAARLLEVLASDPSRSNLSKHLPAGAVDESVGVDFRPVELEAVRGYAQAVAGLAAERARLEALVASEAREAAPNLSRVVGDLLAARLLSQAGSLERLATLPASTIQTLGAETALFAHLKDGKRPPKHGVLFQHPLVNAAPRHQRGRFARVLASNAAIASRLDAADPSLRPESERLVQRVEAAIARIKSAPARPRVVERRTVAARPQRRTQGAR